MKILVNNKETEISPQSSIKDLALSLQLSENGIAIAVNNKMVQRVVWESFILNENDSLVIIKAACGG